MKQNKHEPVIVLDTQTGMGVHVCVSQMQECDHQDRGVTLDESHDTITVTWLWATTIEETPEKPSPRGHLEPRRSKFKKAP